MEDRERTVEEMFNELIEKAAAYGLPPEAIERLEMERDEFLADQDRKRKMRNSVP